jgi:hypothetical protein
VTGVTCDSNRGSSEFEILVVSTTPRSALECAAKFTERHAILRKIYAFCHHGMALSWVADGGGNFQIWKISENIFENQLVRADKGLFPRLGVGRGADNSSP